jgi:excisionase family DNA binding protein
MARATPTHVTTETALFARDLIAKLGLDESLVVGNAATGASTPLPPAIANLVRQVLVSLAAGRDVTIAENLTEVTPNEAAEILNVSRTFVTKLMDEGQLPFRMVGSHRRIPYPDLIAYRDEQMVRSRKAMDDLYAIDRELGLDTLDGPPPDKSTYRGSGVR